MPDIASLKTVETPLNFTCHCDLIHNFQNIIACARTLLYDKYLEAKNMKLLKWLSVADRFAKAYLDERLAPLGINSSQHIYLLKVCDHPGISQDSLLDSVYIHPSNMVRMVASLEKKGFLTRTPCEQDKRTWQLYPTQRALDISRQIRAACAETERALMDGLSPETQAEFQAVLAGVGRRMAEAQGVVRKGDEFDER